MGEGSGAAHGDPTELALGQINTGGGPQHHLGSPTGEGDQGHPVTAHVGVLEQGQDGAPGRVHPLLGVHACRGIHGKDDQIANPTLAHLLAQVLRLQLQLGGVTLGPDSPLDLVGRRRPQGGVQGQIGGMLHLPSAHVAPPAIPRAGLAPAAATPPAQALARKLDPSHLEALLDLDRLGGPGPRPGLGAATAVGGSFRIALGRALSLRVPGLRGPLPGQPGLKARVRDPGLGRRLSEFRGHLTEPRRSLG